MAEADAKLYTLTEVAKLTKISMPTLQRYKKLYQERIPSKGSGRSQRYPEQALAVFRQLKEENMGRRGRPRKTAVAAASAKRASAKSGVDYIDQARVKHPRAYMRWTEEEDKLVAGLYDEGWIPSRIARRTLRQSSAIRSRLRKLGRVPRRTSVTEIEDGVSIVESINRASCQAAIDGISNELPLSVSSAPPPPVPETSSSPIASPESHSPSGVSFSTEYYKMHFDIFISYAREDSDVAENVFRELSQHGIRAWFDREHLLPGQRWKAGVKRAVSECRIFLALMSKKSIDKRGYVQKELRIALEELNELPPDSIYLIPVRLDDCLPTHEALSEIQWVDLFPEFYPGFKKILSALQAAGIGESQKAERKAEGGRNESSLIGI